MTDQEFNLYMKKFDDRYFITVNEDNVRVINGKYGKIAPFDPENQFLGVWCINISPWLKKSFLKRLCAVFIEVHQECDSEFGAYFHEKHLDEVCKVIKAKRRPKISDELRQERSMQAKINFRSNGDE
jgi:hypothetical protein